MANCSTTSIAQSAMQIYSKFLVRLHGEYNILVKLCGKPRKFIIADPNLRIEGSAVINLRDVSTKPNKYIRVY